MCKGSERCLGILALLALVLMGAACGSTASGSPTSVSTLSAPVTSLSNPPPDKCQSDSVSISASVTSGRVSVCVVQGARLHVSFDKSRAAFGVPGPWGVPHVEVDSSILTSATTSKSGNTLTTTLDAQAPGSAVVRAGFNNECSSRNTTHCTIPPQTILEVDVRVVPPSAPTTLPPQAGYRGIENFCAVAPLTGTIHYDGRSGSLTGVLSVSISGLPPNDEVNVNWSNDHVRVPVIGGFETDSKGTSIHSSVVVGRLGEVRGVEVVLTAASVPNPVLGRLEPC
jgi:hypothetical protein